MNRSRFSASAGRYQDFQYFLTSAAGPWSGPLAWVYDRIGNRTTETRNGVTDTYAYTTNGTAGNTPLLDLVTLGIGGSRDYTFGPAGHLELLSAGANAVDFDNDLAGQLGGVSRASGHAADFRFDGRGFLHEVVALTPGSGGGSGDLPFLDAFESGDICGWSTAAGWGGPQCPSGPVESRETATYDSAGRLHALVPTTGGDPQFVFYFAGRPVATYTAAPTASWKLLTTDHLGTPVHALGLNGTTLWSGGFEPFGKDFTTPSAATQGIFLRLPGQWNDGLWNEAALGTELHYNVHRWYEQQTGRYTTTDPLRRMGRNSDLAMLLPSGHDYAYVLNRPLFWVDPRGLEHVTPSDWQNCLLSPFDCGDLLDCRDEAFRATVKRFGSQGHNDGADAYRHCYWSCCSTKRIGASATQAFTDGHERFPDNSMCEANMDYANNTIGRGTGPNGPATDCDTHCSSRPLVDKPLGPCCSAGIIAVDY